MELPQFNHNYYNIIGGITMNDEASTSYTEEINQMTNGAQFLLQELGIT